MGRYTLLLSREEAVTAGVRNLTYFVLMHFTFSFCFAFPFFVISLHQRAAYIGGGKAVVQVDTSKTSNVTVGGTIAYLLWFSVYAVKQVDTRSRVLVLFDRLKASIWGRDISQF